MLQCFTRAYILRLIGGILMPDKSSQNVFLMYLPLLADLRQTRYYSWGSAVLAYLYRELCMATDYSQNQISGCLTLLQLWAWDRFPQLRPERPPMPDPHTDLYPLLPPLGFRWTYAREWLRPRHDTLRKYRLLLDQMTMDEVFILLIYLFTHMLLVT